MGAAAVGGGQAPQETSELSGRVVIGSADPQPAVQVEVALHRITRQEGGIVARSATDDEGRFRFSLPADGAEEFPVYLVTARYRGILYFGPPLHGPTAGGPDYLVRVHETRASAAFSAAGRTVTVSRDAGGLQAQDVLELSNPSDSTLVPVAPDAPGWMLRLPEGATNVMVVGEASEPQLRNGALRVESPVPPGGRDVAVRYRLPRDGVRLRLDRPLPALEILVEEGLRPGNVAGLEAESPVRLGQATFRRFAAAGLEPGAAVELQLEAPATRPWGWILAAIGTALAAAAFLTARPLGPRLRQAPPPA